MKDKKVILFQGDSITDAGRMEDNAGLGFGYVADIKKLFDEKNYDYEIINKGISGNRVCDLEARWQADTLDINPDILSIMIGINDVWRKYDSGDETIIESYTNGYRNILTQAKENNPNLKIVLIEPFVIPTPADRIQWRADLDPQIQTVRHLAKEFGAVVMPLDGIFAYYSSFHEYEELAADGVHPTELGHKLVAKHWVEIFEKHFQ